VSDDDVQRRFDVPTPEVSRPERDEFDGTGAVASRRLACVSCGATIAPERVGSPCAHCGRAQPIAPPPAPAATAASTGGRRDAGVPSPPLWSTPGSPVGLESVRLLCICGYDLNATPLGGNCPECGVRVTEALGERDLRVQGRAVAAVVLACSALPMYCACGPLALPLSAIAFVLAISVFRSGDRLLAADRTMAIVALVIGGAGGVIGVGSGVAFLVMIMM